MRKHELQQSRYLNVIWLLGMVCLLLLCSTAAQGQGEGKAADEYDIRAAMLFNITRFVDWRAGKIDTQHRQISVCIVGSDPIGASFDHFLQEQGNSAKTIKVRHLASFDLANTCDVLYVSVRELKSLKRVGAELAKAGVLVISESPNAAIPSQIIGLPTIDEHVHIEVNLSAAKLAGITISSKLLHLATVTR